MAKGSGRVQWHQLFGYLLKLLLSPVGIQVLIEFQLAPSPPIGDVLLLRRGKGDWTKSQLERLPDGIRQSQAKHILLEFKYTEFLNLDTLRQAIMSYTLYIRANKVKEEDIAFFVVLSHQPQSPTLDHFGYRPTELAGLYDSTQPTLSNISLMLLNELPPTPNNAFIKCFASQKQQQKAAFEQLNDNPLLKGNEALRALLFGLLNLLFANGGKLMENETITPDKLQKVGQQLMKAWLAYMPPAERVAGLRPADLLSVISPTEFLAELPPAERVAGLRPADLLSVISPTEFLAELPPAERVAGLRPADLLSVISPTEFLAELPPAERVAGLRPAERMDGLRPAERMDGLSQAEIEDYLAQLKAKNDLV